MNDEKKVAVRWKHAAKITSKSIHELFLFCSGVLFWSKHKKTKREFTCARENFWQSSCEKQKKRKTFNSFVLIGKNMLVCWRLFDCLSRTKINTEVSLPKRFHHTMWEPFTDQTEIKSDFHFLTYLLGQLAKKNLFFPKIITANWQ